MSEDSGSGQMHLRLRHRQMKIELSRRDSADEGSATCSHPGRARRKASNSHRLAACLQERQHLTIRSLRDPSRPRQGQDVATVEIPSATPEHTSHCHCCNRGARVKRLAMSPIASAVAHSRFALLGSRARRLASNRKTPGQQSQDDWSAVAARLASSRSKAGKQSLCNWLEAT